MMSGSLKFNIAPDLEYVSKESVMATAVSMLSRSRVSQSALAFKQVASHVEVFLASIESVQAPLGER
jgi:hypothetical protein